ncbi:hypothetical protein ASG22_03155 [Chryseobacterium sp. Leaf405]|uniref:hypothetical protein n=1 Tax=Chryseobacterium sp. Leaf405 TaxID=1736367 RepID=UPI0006F80888|nr:hypothetical protein [Chryseobacterium sp. Leaf405]KQT25723.1 hypothetical protein ASG22_03155 [Chryseobacterium sp. Leaf405]
MASRIADMQVAKGDKSEGKNHEYYVTVDYYGKIAGESKNINIKNPNDNPIQRAYELQYPERVPQKPQQPNKRPIPPPVKPKKDTFKAPITAGAKTKAPDPKGKILSTHFVNLAQQPIQYLQMGVPFYAKIRSQGMKGKTVKLNLFEDDTFDDLVYEQNVTLTSDVCLCKITITDKMREKGGDLYGQQYFIEIEYSAQSVKSSVLNLRDDAILTKLKTAVSTAGVKKQEILKDKESKCFCNKDFTEADVKKFVKLLKGSEIIWEGQVLRGGRRAECNISDKSFSKLTNALNSAFKKYKINTCAQKMHFLAQVTEETGTFSLSEETAGQYASSQSIYKGRGLLQLTGIKNNTGLYNNPGPYQNYADYKNDQNIVRNPNIVANDVNYCIDSGAWIWSVNKKMPNAPSEAVDRWGKETSGKSLNELAEFGDKYLELISVLLNGRNKDTDMPNGWAKRQANYKLLKTGFFIYEKFHGNQAMKSKNAQDIATFNIYHNGKIEKYIPKNIKSGYEGMYKYLYYDINNNEHEICMVDFISVNKRQNGSTINSIPRGYIKTYSYPQGGNARTAYVYANGDICVEGTGYGFKKYPKGIGKVELVRMKDSLSYEKDNVRIFYSFKNSQRRYCNPESYAAFLGALAALNRTDVLCTGMCFEDATSYPSVTHPNGDSADTAYFPTLALEQKKVNAFKSFNFKNIYRGGSGWYPNLIGTKYSRGHEDHLHAGDFDSNIVIIIKE